MSSTAGQDTEQQTGDGAAALPAVPRAAPGDDPGERRRRNLRLTVWDMVVSMAVILAIATAIWALFPRPNAVPMRTVDVVGAARQAAPRLTFEPAVPTLPAGWVPTSAGLRDSADGVITWHIGYTTPDGHYASIEQAAKPTREWESIMDSGGTLRAPVDVDGTRWEQRYKDVREVTALIHRGETHTTMITSKTGGLGPAQVLARAIAAQDR